ncbi:LCP family glycopolymer transferase [Nocardioides luteus]|uniref:LCP family glycopolymer transferase n=1 Tax=Nocardioides luteus TaxID=1844 RepID=UPI001A2D5A15|nr:LCP family protein [Nocardioides luteus]MBG6098687.1 LCP family protein required for cell wall assembly [Nocardioides luteus]
MRREPTRAERYQAMGRGSAGASPTPAPPSPQEWGDPDLTAVAPALRETPRETPRPARHVPPPPAPTPSLEETAVAPAPEWYRQDPQPVPSAPKVPDQQLAPPAAREFDWNAPAPAERPRGRTSSRDELHEARHEAYPAPERRGASYASGYDDEPYDDYPPQGGYEEPYAPYPGDEDEDRDKPRISVWQVLSSTLLVLALIVGLFVVYTYRDLKSNITTVSLGEKAADVGPKEPINILVMGSDSRDCEGCGVDGESGGGSDTNILLHLSANRKFAYGVSIPRDTMVNRPSCKTEDGSTAPAEYVRWNAAYATAGPTCTITQLESVASEMCGKKCDITVNHLVVVDFASFKGMVDAIDGVDVCLPEEVDDKYTGAHFDAGKQRLTGKQALNYVRLRHGLGDGGDLDRSKRQQAFIGSMAAKLLSGDTLSSPTKVLSFLNAATKGLTMDEGLKDNLETMAKIGAGFKSIGMENIKFLTIPTVPDPENPEATVVLDEEKAKNVFKAIANDKPLTKKIAAGALDAGEASGKKSKDTGDAPSDSGSTDGETADTKPSEDAATGESSDTASDGASSGASEEELAQIAEEAKAARERAGLC